DCVQPVVGGADEDEPVGDHRGAEEPGVVRRGEGPYRIARVGVERLQGEGGAVVDPAAGHRLAVYTGGGGRLGPQLLLVRGADRVHGAVVIPDVDHAVGDNDVGLHAAAGMVGPLALPVRGVELVQRARQGADVDAAAVDRQAGSRQVVA